MGNLLDRLQDKLLPSRKVTLLWLIVSPSILLIINYSQIAEHEGLGGLGGGLSLILLMVTYFLAFTMYIPFHAVDYVIYFKGTRVVEAVKEYQFSKKLFYVTAVISTLSLFLYLANLIVLPSYQLGISFHSFSLTIFSFAAVILGIRFYSQYARKDFGFYLARACYIGSLREEDIIQKFKYLTLTLDTYNKFLERSLELKIKDIMPIYSIFVSASAEQKIKITELIGNALEKDKLELARQLVELSGLQDKEQFLIRERKVLNQRFRDILVTIIPTIISTVSSIIALISPIGAFFKSLL